MPVRFRFRFLGLLLLVTPGAHAAEATIQGSLKVWFPLTLTFNGPVAKETDDVPNPFLDYRLIVTFKGPNGHELAVPGFFDGDGNGNGQGSAWRVRFSPDQAGKWR